MKLSLLHFRNILLRLPSWILIIGGCITWLYWKSISLTLFLILAIKLLTNKSQWSSHFKSSLLKVVLVTIVVERIFSSLLGTWYWEYSRGGARFHLEDFWSDKQMSEYINQHYPEGSDARVLMYDLETAGVQCSGFNDMKEEKKASYTQGDKEKYDLEDFSYISSFSCKKSFSIIRLFATYYIDVFLDEDKKIVKVIAFVDPFYI